MIDPIALEVVLPSGWLALTQLRVTVDPLDVGTAEEVTFSALPTEAGKGQFVLRARSGERSAELRREVDIQGEFDVMALAMGSSRDRSQRLHDLLHGKPAARLAAAATHSLNAVLSEAEHEALSLLAKTAEPSLARLAVRAFGRAGPAWERALAAVDALSADPVRSTLLATEIAELRAALGEAKSREALRTMLLTSFRSRPTAHHALAWVKSVESEPDARLTMEFFRDGNRWGARMLQAGDRAGEMLAAVGHAAVLMWMPGDVGSPRIGMPRWDASNERLASLTAAATGAAGVDVTGIDAPFGHPCFGLTAESVEDEPTKFRMAVNVKSWSMTPEPTPPWLEARQFHAPGVSVESRAGTVVWKREREERIFGIHDGMPLAWSIVRDYARLVGRSTKPAWSGQEWQRALDAADAWWAETPDRSTFQAAFLQTNTVMLVISARDRLASEPDWKERTAAVARAVAVAYCAAEDIRAKTRDAAMTASKSGPATDAAVDRAVASILPGVV